LRRQQQLAWQLALQPSHAGEMSNIKHGQPVHVTQTDIITQYIVTFSARRGASRLTIGGPLGFPSCWRGTGHPTSCLHYPLLGCQTARLDWTLGYAETMHPAQICCLVKRVFDATITVRRICYLCYCRAGQGRTGLLATATQAARFDAVICYCIQHSNIAIYKHSVAVLPHNLRQPKKDSTCT